MAIANTVKSKANEAAEKASPWIEIAGRWGYAAKGVLYGLIGVLAFIAATGPGGKTTDNKGAINTLAQQPFGHFILIVLGCALLGYGTFKLAMGIFNPERNKVLKRIGDAVTGVSYIGLCYLAFKAAMGDPSTESNKEKAADIMSKPYGVWVIAFVGVVILGVGLMQIAKGLNGKFMDILRTDQMSEEERNMAKISGRIGMISRGVVFAITGGFLLWAAKDHDPSKAGGLGQSLAAIAQAPYGPILLALVGVGLVAFALFMFVEAKYRRFTPVSEATK
jgi:hypothetical protein